MACRYCLGTWLLTEHELLRVLVQMHTSPEPLPPLPGFAGQLGKAAQKIMREMSPRTLEKFLTIRTKAKTYLRNLSNVKQARLHLLAVLAASFAAPKVVSRLCCFCDAAHRSYGCSRLHAACKGMDGPQSSMCGATCQGLECLVMPRRQLSRFCGDCRLRPYRRSRSR